MSKKFSKVLLSIMILTLVLAVLPSTSFAYTFELVDEDITAYVSNGTPCHSGNMPYIGACALHEYDEDPGNPLVHYGWARGFPISS